MRCSTLVVCTLALVIGCAHAPNRTSTTTSSSSSSSTSTGDDGVVSTCGVAQVFFASGSASLDGDARVRLETYAGCLSRAEIDTIFVSGMTDHGGDADANLVLGRARAQSVADYLHGLGCDVTYVVRSLGEVGGIESEPLWPIERSASATGVVTP